jgi:Outer membrane protein beta-barrel domain
MKKRLSTILLCLLVALFISVSPAKAQLFDKGDFVIGAGLGLGSVYSTYGGSSVSVPVLFVKGDYCLREDLGPGNLGVGAIMGYGSQRIAFTDVRINSFLLGARGTYHMSDLVEQFDFYGGITLGAEIASVDYPSDAVDVGLSEGGMLGEIFVGAHYYFTDNIAAMAEFGFGISVLKLGISFKL